MFLALLAFSCSVLFRLKFPENFSFREESSRLVQGGSVVLYLTVSLFRQWCMKRRVVLITGTFQLYFSYRLVIIGGLSGSWLPISVTAIGFLLCVRVRIYINYFSITNSF